MATKTNLQLKNSLANLWGFADVTDLPTQDQADIQTCVNQALFEVYAPINGTRPNYGEQEFSDIILAPVAATLGVTYGSKTVTGYAFDPKYAGSFVKIGDRFFRFGGRTGSGPYVYSLVQPWDGDTGSVEATVYHNAIALPGTLMEVIDFPEVLGIGLLKPLPGPEWEQIIRSAPAMDFAPDAGRTPFRHRRFNNNIFEDTGDPRFYHVDSASTGATFGLGNRIHVYPVPDIKCTITLRASYMAADPLSADGDIPPMPFDAVDNILLPLAREHLITISAGRRFTGNAQLIMQAAQRARDHLRSLTRPQRSNGGGFTVKKGW